MLGALVAITVGRGEVASYISALFIVYIILIFIRILLSWVPRMPLNPIIRAIVGFVHEVACSTLADRLADVEWYCAGPPPMTQALQTALILEHGVPVGQIHFDRFF